MRSLRRSSPKQPYATPTKVRFRTLTTPQLQSPVLICGLPDAGQVARIVLEELVDQLKAELFLEVYCFSLPARVLIENDGTVDLMKHRLYFKRKANSNGQDLILYTGDVQPENPEAAWEIADKVMDVCESLGANSMVTVGAFITGTLTEHPKVYGLATNNETARDLEATGMTLIKEGDITWMNGILIGLAKMRQIPAIFLAGETPGLPQMEDARAATAVLKVLDSRMKLGLDFSRLEERLKETEALLKTVKEFNEKSRGTESEYIR